MLSFTESSGYELTSVDTESVYSSTAPCYNYNKIDENYYQHNKLQYFRMRQNLLFLFIYFKLKYMLFILFNSIILRNA